jgi:TetR/AcrR family transcriptional regulator, lmrAB and yxaGH operons repressor
MAKDTRDRLLNSTATLIQKYGLHGASLNSILDEGEAPRGSLYYFFPGGKEQLVLEATVRSVEVVTSILKEMLASQSAADAVRSYFAAAADELAKSGFVFGCPVTPIIMDLDEPTAALAAVCRDAMANWCDMYEKGFGAAGMSAERARSLAILAIASLEGSLIMARAARNTEAISVAGEEVAQVVERTLTTGRSGSQGTLPLKD